MAVKVQGDSDLAMSQIVPRRLWDGLGRPADASHVVPEVVKAIGRAGGAIAPIGRDVRYGGELSDIRTLAAVKLERTAVCHSSRSWVPLGSF